MPTWLKLKQPSTVWNSSGVKPHRHKFTEFIKLTETPSQMVSAHIGSGSKHLVINCHAYAGPRMAIGTGIEFADLEAFKPISDMRQLKVIWLAGCNLTYWPLGPEFCTKLAGLSSAYVVAHTLALPDREPPANCIEDTFYAMRTVFDPFGELVTPSAFYTDLAAAVGFEKVPVSGP